MLVKHVSTIREVVVASSYNISADDYSWALTKLYTKKKMKSALNTINIVPPELVVMFGGNGHIKEGTFEYSSEWLQEYMDTPPDCESVPEYYCFRYSDVGSVELPLYHISSVWFDQSDIAILLTSREEEQRSLGKQLVKFVEERYK